MLLTTIFYEIDNFCNNQSKKRYLSLLPHHSRGGRPKTMSASEILTIIVYFQHARYRNFKWYYKVIIQGSLRSAFTNVVSYSRFVELMRDHLWLLALFAISTTASATGISFIDSTAIAVCKNPRISSHKVMKGLAKRGKTSTGWFFGFKLHLVINHHGQIVAFLITPGNVDDRNPEVVKKLTKKLFGKLFGDRGYISAKLFDELWQRGIQLITRLKKKMRNKLMLLEDKLILRRRGIIESVNNLLKNCIQIEHTRHRSKGGFFVNIFAAIAAYFFYPNKPCLPEAKCINSQRISCD